MNIDRLCRISLDYFDHAKDIDASTVPFDDEVRKMCEQNSCGSFGKSWTCPPAVDSVENLKSQVLPYERFMIVNKIYTLEDSFDWEGMVNSAKDFQLKIRAMKKAIDPSTPGLDFKILGAGACQICKTCSYLKNEPCKKPDEAVFSLEAYGVDVMKMLKENGMRYNNGKDTVTYVGGVFWSAKKRATYRKETREKLAETFGVDEAVFR